MVKILTFAHKENDLSKPLIFCDLEFGKVIIKNVEILECALRDGSYVKVFHTSAYKSFFKYVRMKAIK